jgi:hypothetical protein
VFLQSKACEDLNVPLSKLHHALRVPHLMLAIPHLARRVAYGFKASLFGCSHNLPSDGVRGA